MWYVDLNPDLQQTFDLDEYRCSNNQYKSFPSVNQVKWQNYDTILIREKIRKKDAITSYGFLL